VIHDLYLRAANEAAIDAALESAGLGDFAEGLALDRIGDVPGATGYHANLRLLFEPTPEQLGDLDAVTISAPAQPYRVWA
jgi:hypothetical protein